MMHAIIAALLLAATPATQDGSNPTAAPIVTTPAAIAETGAQREERYLRQQVAVDNARQQVETLRAEAALKDELLLLARDRNAELYAVASEILARHARQRSWEVFVQGSRVRMENLVQSYEDRLRAARVTAATLPPSVEQRMQRELTTKDPAAAPVPTDANPK